MAGSARGGLQAHHPDVPLPDPGSGLHRTIPGLLRGLPGTPIYRVAHPSLFRMLRNLVYQPPERCAIIEASKLSHPDYRAQNRLVCRLAGVDEDTWVASGVRCADSVQRRTHFLRHGAITHRQRTFYPVWDWRKHYLLAELRCAGCKLPVDYAMFGRSFDGLDWRFLNPVRLYYPVSVRPATYRAEPRDLRASVAWRWWRWRPDDRSGQRGSTGGGRVG